MCDHCPKQEAQCWCKYVIYIKQLFCFMDIAEKFNMGMELMIIDRGCHCISLFCFHLLWHCRSFESRAVFVQDNYLQSKVYFILSWSKFRKWNSQVNECVIQRSLRLQQLANSTETSLLLASSFPRKPWLFRTHTGVTGGGCGCGLFLITNCMVRHCA